MKKKSANQDINANKTQKHIAAVDLQNEAHFIKA
jgi:hypothetical protein